MSQPQSIHPPHSPRQLVVFGSSRCQPGESGWEQARQVGEVAARRGMVLVSGGYDGSMGAASEGAGSAGGAVVGITTPIFIDRSANRHVNEERSEHDYPARLAALLRAGDAFVALPGGIGTASEWITAWCLASIGQLPGPLWLFEDPWKPIADGLIDLPEIGSGKSGSLAWVKTPSDFDRLLNKWLNK